jgi:hypothetical protein
LTTPQEKGDALEAAVAAIENLILQTSPGLREKTYFIESKKILEVGGVRHEIDIYVTIDLGKGYKSIFIFECKNWKDAVGKNEIIVFAEKIDACHAQHGHFVAKSLTSDAVAQAKKDPRITLLTATEHDIATMPVPFEFFGRFPQFTKVDATFSVRGSKGSRLETVNFADAQATYLGNHIDLLRQVEAWSREACDEDVMAFFVENVPEGVYPRTVDYKREFRLSELVINQAEIEKLSLHVDYQVIVQRSSVVSHFEVQSRGRVLKFAPMTVSGNTIEARLVISTPH